MGSDRLPYPSLRRRAVKSTHAPPFADLTFLSKVILEPGGDIFVRLPACIATKN